MTHAKNHTCSAIGALSAAIAGLMLASPTSAQTTMPSVDSISAVAAAATTRPAQAAPRPAGPQAAAAPATPAQAPDETLVASGLDEDGILRLSVDKNAVLTTADPYKDLSIANPAIADINLINPTTILVTAKKAGSTQLTIWNDAGKSQSININVQFDVRVLQEQYNTMFPGSNIEVSSANGAIALKGRVPSLQVAEQASQLAAPYATSVLNFLEVSGGQQVMLQVRFAEVSRSATNALGVNLFAADGSFAGGSNIGQVSPVTNQPFGNFGDTPAFKGIEIEAPGHTISPSVTLYGAGQIGSFYLEYFVEALRQNNLLRVLAEPNLIAISGQEASFLAGGEFPVPVPQAGDGGTVITIEYREFGVKLKFVPIVQGNGKIMLKVEPEVSDLDYTAAVRTQGFLIPGLRKRTVSTTVEMSEGQTFAIAGLLDNKVVASKDVTPLLGDLPILGALFRSVRYERRDTELVVLVTPILVEPMNPGEVPALPGERWRHPTEGELFWLRDLGGPETDKTVRDTEDAAPRRFQGQFGFTPASATADTGDDLGE